MWLLADVVVRILPILVLFVIVLMVAWEYGQ